MFVGQKISYHIISYTNNVCWTKNIISYHRAVQITATPFFRYFFYYFRYLLPGPLPPDDSGHGIPRGLARDLCALPPNRVGLVEQLLDPRPDNHVKHGLMEGREAPSRMKVVFLFQFLCSFLGGQSFIR
jgi:hypothetical protein